MCDVDSRNVFLARSVSEGDHDGLLAPEQT
jgi:hypothetical protein